MNMKIKEIRVLSATEIETKLAETRDKVFKQKFQKALGQMEGAHKVRESRKTVARLLTVLQEKRKENGQQ